MHYVPEYTDEQLISLLHADSAAAFTEIFNRYHKRLFVEAYNELRNVEDAHDVVQEIFVRLWQKRKSTIIRTSILSYLLQSVRYKCIDTIRANSLSQKRKRKYEMIREPNTGLSTNVENIELGQQIMEAIDTIASPRSRHAFTKLYLEQKTHKEIAQEMGISVQSTRNLVSHALKILQKKLKKVL